MKTHSSSPRAAFRLLAALLVTVALLFAGGAQAQSTNWLTGVNVFSNAVYGVLASDSDVVDNATLIITNGGVLFASQFNVGPTNRATNTLDIGGTLFVKTLLATNVIRGGVTNSILNLNAGALITSNAATAVAANIILASNASFSINSSWAMNGGTNFIYPVNTNGTFATLYIGNGVNNAVVTVNSNAVFNTQNPWGFGAANSTNLTINIGNGPGFGGNQLILTNGGRVIARKGVGNGDVGINVGAAGNNSNSIIVAGADISGNKAILDLAGINSSGNGNRLIIGGTAINTNNYVLVGAGGVITNVNLYSGYNGYTNGLTITNGGQVYANSLAVGRTGFGAYLNVAGADSAGNRALLAGANNANFDLFIGGSGGGSANAATNCTIYVGQSGLVTNINAVRVGPDTNSVGNTLIITNGGQLFSATASAVGAYNNTINANTNSVIIGGSFGTTNSLWNLGNQSLTVGATACTNNFVTLNPGAILTNVSSITLGGVNARLTFNGGKLSASAGGNLIAANTGVTVNTSTNWVQAGGAIIDSGAFSVVSQLPLSQDPSSTGGALTKLGTGTLQINGASTITGPITNSAGTLNFSTLSFLGAAVQTLSNTITGSGAIIVSSGTLIYNGDASAATNTVTVTNNAGYGGRGTNGGSVIMAAGTALIPGGYTNVGTLTLTNTLALNGNNLFFDLAGAANDKVVIGNSLALNGVNTIYLSGAAPVGTNTLMTFASTNGSGSFVLGAVYPNVALITTATNVQLAVTNTGFASLTWKGAASGMWDTSAINWTNGAVTTNFTTGDSVIFDDSLAANPVVTNSAPVSPSSITVNNNATNYTLAAAIAGSGGLTKQGGGRLDITGANSYSGNTILSGGVTTIANSAALGSTAGGTRIIYDGSTSGSSGARLEITNGITLDENITIAGSRTYAQYEGAFQATGGSNTLTTTLNLDGGSTSSELRIGARNPGTILNLANSLAINRIGTAASNTGQLIITANGGSTIIYNGAIDNNGGIVEFVDGGTNILNAVSTDVGQLTIDYSGLVKLGVNNAFPATSPLKIGQPSGNTSTDANATAGRLDLNGYNLTVSAFEGGGGTTTALRRVTNSASTGTATLTIGGSGTLTYDGVIENGTAGGTVAVTIVKTGGAQTFAGSLPNTYAGLTTISGGTLSLNKGTAGTNAVSGDIFIGAGTLSNGKSEQIADTATVTLNNTNASWFLNGSTETVSNVNLQASAPGSGNGLTLGANGTLIVTGTFTESGGDFTMNSSLNGGTLIANAFAYTGGLLTMGNGNLTTNGQRIIIGAGGMTIGAGGSISISSSINPLCTNYIYLIGDLTSLAATNSNVIYDMAGVDSFKLDSIRTFNVADGLAVNDLVIAANIANGTNAGGILKIGAGTLVLSSNNTYTGFTTISNGALVGFTGGSCSNSVITNAPFATLGVSVQTVGGQWTCSNLVYTSGNTLDLNFNTLPLSTTVAPLRILNAWDFNSAAWTISIRNAAVTNGTYPLVTNVGSQLNYVAPVFNAPGIGGYITNDVANRTISLVVTNGGNVLFWATNSGAWNINTSTNWKSPAGSAQVYIDPAVVVFDDTASGTGTILVTNQAPVSPVSVTVNATNKSYTLSGSPISGTTALTKTGNGTLTLAGTNNYSGVTLLNGGPVTISGSLSGTTLLLNSNTLTLSGSLSNTPVAIVSAMTFTESAAGVIAGPIVITNSGTLTLAGTNSFAGGVINSGNVNINGAFALGTGPLTINNGMLNNSSGGVLTNLNNNAITFSNADLSYVGSSSLHLGNGTVFWVGGTRQLNITNTLTIGGTNGGLSNLSKNGPGTLVLAGVNTNSGTMTVSFGKLLVTGDSTLATNRWQVNAGATLFGTGTIGGTVTNLPNSYLTPGNLTSRGVLTLTNGLGLNGAILSFTLTNAGAAGVTYDTLSVTNGAFVANGTNVIQVFAASGTLTNGTYTLITNLVARTGTGTFVFANGSTNMGNLWLTNGPNSVVLGVTANTTNSGSLLWKGSVSGTWDTNTANWFNGVQTTYAEGAYVMFDDTASQFTLTNGGGSPASVTFNNYINTYNIAAVIGGAGGITKNGGANLNLTSSNTYTGPTMLNNGTIYFTSLTNVGGGASAFGAPVTAGNGIITMNGGCSPHYTGVADSISDRIFNWISGTLYNDSTTGKLILTSPITNGLNGNLTFRGAGIIVVSGFTNLGSGAITRTDGGTVILTNQLNLFGGTPQISDGKFFIDTIANTGVACSIGTGSQINLGQGSATAGTLQLAVTNGSSCNRAIFLLAGSGAITGGTIENTVVGTTVTFSGNITMSSTNTGSASLLPVLTLAGVGDGVFSGSFINTNLLAIPPLIKSGSGTWTLSSQNTNRGPVTVSAGKLLITGDSTQATNLWTVNVGGTLGGTGTIGGNVTNLAGSFLAPGGLTARGKLTLTNGLGLNGATLSFALTNAAAAGVTYDQLAVTNGAFVANSTNYIQIFASTGTLTNGTYTLITNVTARSGGGLFVFPATGTTNWTVGANTLQIATNANSVLLVVPADTALTNLTWKGAVNGVWDAVTANWFNGGPAKFADGAIVTFDDSAIQFNLTSGGGSPASVTFNNNLNTYNLSAAIGGPGGLVKNGSGALALFGASTYSGPTVLNAGTNFFNTLASNGIASSFGSNGAVVVAGSSSTHLRFTNAATDSISDRILNWTAGGQLWIDNTNGTKLILTGGITNGNNTGLTIRGPGNIVVSGPIKIGSGSLNRTDGGTLVLTNALNPFNGNIQIMDGKYYIDTISNSTVACSIGAGSQITLGQISGGTTGTLQLAVPNGSASDRSLLLQCTTSGGGTIENTVAGNTVTFNGNVTLQSTNTTAANFPVLTLTGVGNGVLAGTLGINTNPVAKPPIVKTGAGTWTISGLNTNSGTVAVSGGTLLINGNSAGATNAWTVNAGGTLGGTGTIGGKVTANAGGALAAGGYSTIGTLTLTNGLALNGNFLYFDLSTNAGISDQVVLTNVNLSYGGSNNIVLNFPLGTAPAGTNILMTYPGTNGSPGNFYLLGTYTNVLLLVTTTNVQLVVSNGGTYANNNNLTWNGNVSGTWDLITANWVTNGVSGAIYAEGNAVLFDDSSTNFSVSGGFVAPALVTVNATNNYTIASPITNGAATLVKLNTGILTLAADSTYTNSPYIYGGVIQLGAGGTSGNLGAGASVFGNGNQIWFNRIDPVSIPFVFSNKINSGGAIFVVKSGAVQIGGAADNTSFSGSVASGATLILAKASASGVHSLGGNVTVSNNAVMMLAGSGNDQIYDGVTVTILSGGVFDLNGMNETMSVLNLNGTGTNNVGALINSAAGTTSGFRGTNINGAFIMQGSSSIGGSGNIIITNVISGTGQGLTKVGTGIVTILGSSSTSTNTYSGNTLVSAGELVGGTTGGSCPFSAFTVSSGATNGVLVQAAGGQWVVSNLVYSAGSPYLDLNFNGNALSNTVAPMLILNNLDLTGSTLTINVRNLTLVTNGTYPLITYGGTLSGYVTPVLTLPAGIGGSLVTNLVTKTISLVVTNGNNLFWAVGSGKWDINATANWKDQNGVAPLDYLDPAAVTFDDTASGSGTILVTNVSVVSPLSVTVNVTNDNYAISGSAIAGGTSLTKNGPGALILSGNNTYTGNTTNTAGTLDLVGPSSTAGSLWVNAGTLIVRDPNAIGFGSANFATNGTLQFRLNGGGNITVTNRITSSSSGSITMDVNNNGTGTGGLVQLSNLYKVGAGQTTTVSGGNGYNLSIDTVYQNSGGGGAGGVTHTLNPTTASLTIRTLDSVHTNATDTFVLGGTSQGNALTGVISNATAGTFIALTKSGSSTWTLSGTNAYSGATLVNGGALLVNGDNSAATNAVTVTKANFGGSGIVGGNVIMNAGGTLVPGGISSVGMLTLTNNLALNGGSLFFKLANNTGTNDLVAVGSALSVSNVNNLYLSGSSPAGTNILMTFAATNGPGSFALGVAYTNVALVLTATNLQLVVGAGGFSSSTLLWKGYQSGGWDDAVNQNWFAGMVTNFNPGNDVVFDDGLTSNSIVSSANPVLPASVTFNNNLTNYTISASIGGTVSLVQNGAAATTLTGTNTYTGTTTVGGGLLVIGGSGSLGSGTYAGNIVNNSKLTFAGSADQTLSGVISGAGILTNSGLGTLTLSGVNTYTGPAVVSKGGILLINGDNSAATNSLTLTNTGSTLGGFGTNGGSVTMYAGAELLPGGPSTVGTLTLTNNLTLNGNKFFFKLANTTGTNDMVVVGGALSVGGANLIYLSGGSPTGTNTLITYGSPISGSGTFALASAYANVSLITNGNSLQLAVVDPGFAGGLTWKGYINGVWDDAVNQNWLGVMVTNFNAGDSVTFDDSLDGNSTISSLGLVQPKSVLFNNSANDYFISATIGGTGGLTKSGTSTAALAGQNSYSSNTIVNAGTLVVTNGGAINSPLATLNIGPGAAAATNTLANGGAITVQTLLATNVVLGGVTNSVFNFSGGTLTTSNNNGIAANIIQTSNTTYSVLGNWNMNAGTNFVVNVATNFVSPLVYFGNANNNLAFNVNSNAVLSLANPAINSTNQQLQIANGSSTNNVFTVNGGVVNNVNQFYVGSGGSSVSNQLIITNGGQFTLGTSISFSYMNGNYGSIIVAGTNGAGQRATLDLGGSGDRRIYVVNSSSAGNLLRVDTGGVLTNIGLQYSGGYNGSVVVTNGGQLYAGGGIAVGRNGATNNSLIVAGFDGSGSNALVSGTTTLDIGGSGNGGSTGGTNNWVRVDQGGFLKMANIYVGGHNLDQNSTGNYLIITNGGQVTITGASTVGAQTNGVGNWAYVGGNFGLTNSLWNLSGQTLTIGAASVGQTATNNYVILATGGLITNGSSVIFGGVNSLLNIKGGTLALTASGSGSVIATNATTVNPTNLLSAGGQIIIDTVGYTVASQVPVQGGGSLTKNGSGTLVMLGANNLGGPITNNAGTLNFAGTNVVQTLSGNLYGSGALIVSAGTLIYNGDASAATNTVTVTNSFTIFGGNSTTLGGSGIFGGNVTLSSGCALMPGGYANVGTLALTNKLSLTNNALFFDLAAGTNDVVAVGGALTVNGTNTIYLAGSTPAGTNILMTFAATNGSGTFVLGDAYPNVSLVTTPTNLQLVVTGAGFAGLTWKGNVSGTWDIGGPANWFNGVSTTFAAAANVVFDDTLTANPVITNSGAVVSPGSMTFNNNLTNYTISANIGGSGGLTKLGAATVTLGGSNSYSGVTTVNLGVLAISNSYALGSTNGGTVIYHAGSSVYGGQLAISGGITLAEPIFITGPGESYNGLYNGSINVTGGTNTITGTITLATNTGTRFQGGSSTVLNINGVIQRNGSARTTTGINFAASPTYNINTPMQLNGGNVSYSSGGGVVFYVAGSDIGDSSVNWAGVLKIAANNALSPTNNLNVGSLANQNQSDTGIFYLLGVSQTVNSLNAASNTLAGTYSSNSLARRITSTNSNAMTLTVGSVGGGGTFDGVIENGTGGGTIAFTKVGGGTEIFAGNMPNTYTGLTTISNGVLQLAKLDGTNSISGNVLVLAGTLQNLTNNQIADNATVTLNSPVASWNLGTRTETVANVDMQNATNWTGSIGGLVVNTSSALTITNVFNHVLGDITLSSGAPGSSITAATVTNLGGNWIFGSASASQRLIITNGLGLTIGGGSTISIASAAASTNYIYLSGNLTSLANANANVISDAGGYATFRIDGPRTFDVADGAAASDLTMAINIANGANAGAITKVGAGTLTLGSNNTYTGSTTVSNGALVGLTGGSCSNSAFTVAASATNGVSLLAANGKWTCSSLTYGAGSTYLDLNFNSIAPSTTVAPVQVLNNLDLTGSALSLNLRNAAFANGTYPLITYGGTLSGYTTPVVLLPAGLGCSIVTNLGTKTISLQVTNANSVFWATSSGNWDINATANWKDQNGVAPLNYLDGAFVTLDDTASGTGTILVTNLVTVNPAGVTVNVTNKNYTLFGSAIGGGATLTKNGKGTLTLKSANTYSGLTLLNAGVLAISDPNALGSTAAGIVINENGTTTTGGQLSLSGNITLAEPISLTGPGDGNLGYLRVIDGSTGGTNTITGTITIQSNMPTRLSASVGVLNINGTIQRSAGGTNTINFDPAGTVNINTAIQNNSGGIYFHSGGNTFLNVAGNNIGDVQVQYGSNLKITMTDALATNRNLTIGHTSTNFQADGVGSGYFYLVGANQTINSLNGYPGTNAGPNLSASTRRITSSTNGAMTLTVGNANGSGYFDGVIENGTNGGTIVFTKVGSGSQTNAGNMPNTYTGLTTISGGVLNLSKPVGTNAISGDVLILAGALQNGATSANQIADTATVTLNGPTARWDLNFRDETVATVDMQNASNGVLQASSGLYVGNSSDLTVSNLNHVLGCISINGGNPGGVIIAKTVTNLGGTWNFAAGTTNNNRLIITNGLGLVIGGGSTITNNSSVNATNYIYLSGNLTSLSNASPNMIIDPSGYATFRIEGGSTFNVASGNSASDLTMAINIIDGANAGAITKTGLGILTLSGNNGYTGGTVVSNGVLQVNNAAGSGTGAGAVTVANGATLGGSGAIAGAVTFNTGSHAVFTNGAVLTFNNTVGISGTVDVHLQLSNSVPVGTYVLATNTAGAISGASFVSVPVLDSGSFAPNTAGYISTANNQVILVVLSTYTVTYNANGVSGTAPVDANVYTNGATVVVLGQGALTVPPGYSLTWNTAANGSGTAYSPGNAFAMPANNVTLYAQVAINSYNLIYNAGAGGTISGNASQLVVYHTSGTQVIAVPNAGYAFTNWSDGLLTSNRTDIAQIGGTNVTANFYSLCTSPAIVGGISASATTVGAGGTVTLTLTNVTGSSPLNYQWRSNSVAIAGATGSGYTTPALWVAASGSSYDCVVTNGCGTITATPVSVTVTQAVPGITILSSAQTNGYRDSVTFLATNLPAGATSNVVFTANGVAFSTNDLVSGGTISLAITNLPRGATNQIVATYSGDANYAPVADSLTQTVTNHVPVADVLTEVRTGGQVWHIVWTNLATNWHDADGDILAHSLTNLVSTNGVILTNNGTLLQYPSTAANVNDRFYYTITDGYGGTNTGYVEIVVDPYVGQPVTGQPSTNAISGVPFTVTYYGIPGYTYNLQRNTNLVDGAGWVNITTNVIGGGGMTNVNDYFGDLSPIIPAEAYYRVLWHP